MNKDKLISYSYFFNGEYDQIVKAIRENIDVPIVDIANCLTIFDSNYPKRLLNLTKPPLVLYYKGNIDLINEECISVVGSRNACDYALEATKYLVMNKNDNVIVSGLAKGIDACAHEYAKKTIGVLGCGIDYVYPLVNKDLFKRICNNGLIISEYPANVKPLAYHFPFRNRIISALSNDVYVMQSSKLSGTMTTINEALEIGANIKVLPYSIFDENGIHNNHLINEGAQMIEREEIAF